MRRPVALLVAVLLLAAACADDADSAADASGSGDDSPAEIAACSPARPAAPGSEERTVTHDGEEREYLLHVPEGYDGAGAAPVILNFHGLTSTSEQQDSLSNLPGAGGERGYVVVSPQGLETTLPIGAGLEATYWNVAPAVDTSEIESPTLEAADDLGFVDALLDQIEAELCVDTERVYAAGMSNGAAMAMALACTSDRFAAVAPVAGANFVSDCTTDDPPAVIGFHGTDDVLAPYDGGDTFGFPLGLPAAVDQMAEVAGTAGCGGEAEIESLGDDVEVRRWPGCPDGEDVHHYTVLTGGHTWPGVTTYLDLEAPAGGGDTTALGAFSLREILGYQTETIVATDLMLDFFDAHPA